MVALTGVCGQSNTFQLSSWNQLSAALNLSPNAGKTIVVDSEITIEAHQIRVPIHLDAPIPLNITIRNAGTVPMKNGSCFQLQDPNGYYQSEVLILPSIAIGQQHGFEIELKPAGRPQAEQLPDIVQWTVKDPCGSYYFVRSDGFEIETRARCLPMHEDPTSHNLLFFAFRQYVWGIYLMESTICNGKGSQYSLVWLDWSWKESSGQLFRIYLLRISTSRCRRVGRR
jgi:hypothetical protein